MCFGSHENFLDFLRLHRLYVRVRELLHMEYHITALSAESFSCLFYYSRLFYLIFCGRCTKMLRMFSLMLFSGKLCKSLCNGHRLSNFTPLNVSNKSFNPTMLNPMVEQSDQCMKNDLQYLPDLLPPPNGISPLLTKPGFETYGLPLSKQILK